MGDGSMIQIRDVSKRYGNLQALNKVSLDVARGEVLMIIGPSGSGKSTLLRCINHLEVPPHGKRDRGWDRSQRTPRQHQRRAR